MGILPVPRGSEIQDNIYSFQPKIFALREVPCTCFQCNKQAKFHCIPYWSFRLWKLNRKQINLYENQTQLELCLTVLYLIGYKKVVLRNIYKAMCT